MMASTSTSQTQAQAIPQPELRQADGQAPEVLTLRLVARRRRKKKAVKWAEDVVDNEDMGKKSSKKCCIFHKRRQFGDWGSDEDSDAEGNDGSSSPRLKPCDDCQSNGQV